MNKEDALIIVDVQNDFLETGALPVPNASRIIPVINKLIPKFKTVVITQDWHPADHISFAANHEGASPYETIEVDYGKQVLWPTHCVQDTVGSEIAEGLNLSGSEYNVKKGSNRCVDSYSAFYEADGKSKTPLAEFLTQKQIKHLYFCGLATDFCVSWSAIDAVREGFEVTVIEDACRGIDLNNSVEEAKKAWRSLGIKIVPSEEIA